MLWARMSEETIDTLCTLDPRQAALALREHLEHATALVQCAGCRLRYETRGDILGLEQTPCPACGGALVELVP